MFQDSLELEVLIQRYNLQSGSFRQQQAGSRVFWRVGNVLIPSKIILYKRSPKLFCGPQTRACISVMLDKIQRSGITPKFMIR